MGMGGYALQTANDTKELCGEYNTLSRMNKRKRAMSTCRFIRHPPPNVGSYMFS